MLRRGGEHAVGAAGVRVWVMLELLIAHSVTHNVAHSVTHSDQIHEPPTLSAFLPLALHHNINPLTQLPHRILQITHLLHQLPPLLLPLSILLPQPLILLVHLGKRGIQQHNLLRKLLSAQGKGGVLLLELGDQ